MYVHIVGILAALSAFPYSVLAECVLFEGQQAKLSYRLNISAEECKYVRYNGGGVVTLDVRYPDMKIVYPRVTNDSIVSIYLVSISRGYNQDAIFEGRQPISSKGGVVTYEDGGRMLRRFIGSDGSPVAVSDGAYARRAHHMFNEKLRVSYQYTLMHEDLRRMDDFVIDLINKIIVM